jgi:RHS repeat-associated protein
LHLGISIGAKGKQLKTLQVAFRVCLVLLITSVGLCAQVAPGGNADAIHPAGPPDPQKLDSVWQVDPISGQVTINIPFTTTPQGGRGPKLPFALLYNSASTVTLQAAGSYVIAVPDYNGQVSNYDWSAQPISGSSTAPSGPWTTTGPYIYYSVSNYPNQYSDSNDPSLITAYGCNINGPFIYVDENGSAHDMNLISTSASPGEVGLYGPCAGAQSYVYPQAGYTSFWPSSSTSDGSAIATYNTLQSNLAEGEAIGPDGTSATGSFDLPSGPLTSSTATLTDPNGNSATLTLSNHTYTAADALGRTDYTTNIPIGLAGQIPVGAYSLTTSNESGSAETYNISFSQYYIGTFNMPHPTGSEIGADVAVNSPGPGNSNNKFTAVSEIELPDLTSYQFTYDPTYGTISKITFPTGGYVRFCWGVRDKDWGTEGPIEVISSIVVTDVFTSTGTGTTGSCNPSAAGSGENHWTYAMESVDNSSVPVGKVTAPDGSYTDYVGTCSFDFTAVTLFGGKETCKESSQAIYDSSGNLKMSVAQNFNVQGVPLQVATTLYDGPSPLQQLVNYSYDGYNNVIEKDESHYYTCSANPLCTGPTQSASLPTPPAGWIRSTYTQYIPNSGMASAYIVNKPSQVVVADGGGNAYSLVKYTYDTHGNLTNKSECISASGTYSNVTCSASWQTQYFPDSHGQVTQMIEGYGTSAAATTNYTWTGPSGSSDSYNGYLTKIAHPNSTNDKYTYFADIGEIETHVDWNGNTTSYDYSDPLNRIKSITLPATVDGTTGTSASGGAAYNYTDSAGEFSVQEQQKVSSSGVSTQATTYFDGLGRKVKTMTVTPQCSSQIEVDTTYDSMSRINSVSNPYCSTSDPTYGLTSFAYDGLSRKVMTTLPDNSISTITYRGDATEITDPPNGSTNVQHIQQVDGIGRLTNVCEVTGGSLGSGNPASCGLNVAGSGYLTTYSYDALGNLLSVNQHGLSRAFTYDSLSRLKTSTNPETGVVTYTYPSPSTPCAPNAAVPCNRTDARGVLTTYGYDNMSRLTSKSYTAAAGNTTGALSDLASCYQYDAAISADSNPLGRLTLEWQQAGNCPGKQTAIPSASTAVRILSAHDAMGRVGLDQQCLTGTSCSSTAGNFVYSYNLIGDVVQSNNGIETTAVSANQIDRTNTTTVTAPSITWKTTYDSANHISQAAVQDQPSAFSSSTYLADPVLLNATNYDPFGHMTAAGVGLPYGSTSAAVTVSRQYDPRGWLSDETDGGKVGTSPATGSLGVITVGGFETRHYNLSSSGTYAGGCLAYDTGTVSAKITNGSFNYVASANWGKGDTASSVASKLASAINTTAGSVVTATPDTTNASYVDLFSTGTGAGTDYDISASATDTEGAQYPWFLTNPSFAADTQDMTGGTNADSTYGTIYSYHAGYAPNGNLLADSDFVIGTWNFTYDAVDRLSTATSESSVPSQYSGLYGCWTYDAFGNRTMEAFSIATCNNGPTPQVVTAYNPANNQISSSTASPLTLAAGSYQYDASGNTLYDGNNRYWYDAEGRLCAAQDMRGGSGAVTQYVYDAEGARIVKGTLASAPSPYATCAPPPSTGFPLATWYLVDQRGDQVTEVTEQNGLGTWQHSNVWAGNNLTATWDVKGIHFELADPLGTKRVQANASGQVDETCTSLPFGNDLGNPIGANCPPLVNSLGTEDDATEHHFTQKERDTESGNDYFDARYYSSAIGRFMSPDWSAKEDPVPYAVLDDPQSLNLYAYVRNNPLTRIDPDGHCEGFGCQMQQEWIAQHQITNLSNQELANAGLVRMGGPAQQHSQHLSPIDKVAMKAEAGAIKLTRQALAGGHAAEYGGLILSKNADGSLSSTKPIHTGELSVDIDSVPVPKGFTAVGEYHTHPSTTCCESVGPSVQDVNRLRTPELANRIGYVGDAFTGSVSRYTQREPITGPYDTKTYGTIIGTVP